MSPSWDLDSFEPRKYLACPKSLSLKCPYRISLTELMIWIDSQVSSMSSTYTNKATKLLPLPQVNNE